MKKNHREYLLELIDDLKIPIIPEDAKRYMKELNDEEVSNLVEIFGEVRSFQREVELVTRMTSPKRFFETEEQYAKKVLEIEESSLAKLERIQEEIDEQRDFTEQNTSKELKDLINRNEEDLSEAEKEYKEIYEEFVSAVEQAPVNQ